MQALTRMSTLMTMMAALLLAGAVSAEDRYNPFSGAPPKPVQSAPAIGSGGAGTTSSPGKASDLVLKAVIPMGNPPMANIDGEIVAVGEKFGSYTLRSVGEQGVTLERGGRRFQLMFEYGRKKDAPGSDGSSGS